MRALSVATLVAACIVVALRLVAVDAAEPDSLDSLRQEVRALRAQNATLLRENADLKAKLAVAPAAAATTRAADDGAERQEDKPKNRLHLPANVTIDHSPR